MSSLIFLLFFLYFFSVSSTSSAFSYVNTNPKCSVAETHALLLFKQNLSSINSQTQYESCEDWLGSGYNPIMMNWNTSTDCCDWNGVTCDHSTGGVIGLDLSCGMLLGIIHPNTTLFHLPHLRRLNLAYNDFIGSKLPSNIDMVSNSLTHLNLSNCGFMGQVPNDISHLHKLVSLDLSGTWYDWHWVDLNLEPHVFFYLLQNSTVMEELALENVNISSSLPANLNISSSSLKVLNLGSTGLQGKIPLNMFNLPSLEKLDLSSNSFTGYIPSEISLLTKLTSLDLSSNEIDHLLIPPHVFSNLLQNFTFLRDLWLAEIQIGSVLPTYLNISSSIRSLDLSSTNLQGKFFDNILNLEYLEELLLGGNTNLFGPFPTVNTTTSLPLSMLVLSGTSLYGDIPNSIGHLKSLVYLILSDCGLSGSLPESISNLKHLLWLDLSSNELSGTLPSSLFTLPSLIVTNLIFLDLSHNNFRGEWELDTLLSNLTNLEALSLSYSGISVSTTNANPYVNPYFRILSLASCGLKVFPDWLGEIGGDHMVLLDLSNNSITGTIPDVYADWVQLWGFNLNGNKLEGKVPISLHKCQNLKVIDLGNNHLNDTFPGWLQDLPELQVLVLGSNNFHGGIATSSMIQSPFPSLRVLDLSNNWFVGHLPTKYFQNFNAMKNVVKRTTKPEYLSIYGLCYSVIVVIKGVVQDFTKLLVEYTIVDLSSNKFEGGIPNIIGNLNSLKVLNLSHNRLTGRIPQALGNISEIESLDLSWNQLTGEIPQSLTELTFLESLNMSQNHLVGRIPQGKQFNTFKVASFGGNPKLCGFPLPKLCSEQPQLDGDSDGDDDDDNESEFTWKVVLFGYGCGTLLGFQLGYVMLSIGKPKWFIAAANHMISINQNKRR